VPSGMPRPMWGNGPRSQAVSKPPVPLWGNRSAAETPSSGDAVGNGMLNSPTDAPVFRGADEVPPNMVTGESGTSLSASDDASPFSTGAAAAPAMGLGTSAAMPEASVPPEMSPMQQSLLSDGEKSKGLGDGEKSCVEKKAKKILPGSAYMYELGEKLGEGSYAKVKLCRAVDQDLTFAVKIFKVSLLKRRRLWDSEVSGFKTAFDDVRREIAIMKRLAHENVMNMHDVIDDPNKNKLYMVMDYCPRGAIMETEKMPCEPIKMPDLRRWFTDTVIGLDYLHFQGVVHNDLKPDNILIAGDGRAVISDFGVSRVHPNKSDVAIGAPGTPTYTAPEVWGVGGYAGKIADVWSLGVTLHAMVFGTLPYMSFNQQELIAMVTDPTEWHCDNASCAYPCDDPALLELLTGMMQKVPGARFSLEDVEKSPWAAAAITMRHAAHGAWERIEVNEEELRRAVISGHVNNFRRTKNGTLLKLTDKKEHAMYQALHATPCGAFLPKLHDAQASGSKRVVLELEDLVHGLEQPCMMDVKMGLRTFTESDAHDMTIRGDMLAKLVKIAPDAASEEEKAAGGVVKLRYLQFREQTTTTRTLGFRVEAVQLSEPFDTTNVPSPAELKLYATREQVRAAIAEYLQRRRPLLTSFLQQLKDLRSALEGCTVFQQHSFIRSSLLFVYDGVQNTTQLRMIDLPKVSSAGVDAQDAPVMLNHRIPWEEGNHEDGYLYGVDNLIDIFDELLAAEI